MAGLYVHVPFCIRRCLYCDFYVEPLGTGPIPDRLATVHEADNRPFLDALAAEFATAPGDFAPDTVYIGGGTPTELSPVDLRALFDLLHRSFDLAAVREWTVEANPGTLHPDHLETLRSGGATRLSLGVQSFDDATLESLGRIHTAAEAIETVHELREAGFDNLNLDLIINLPGSDLASVDWDVEQLLRLVPEHASCYALDWTPGTHFTTLRDAGHLREIDQDLAAAQYHHLRRKLVAAGYEHYELFNFARPGRHSRHNRDTWRGGDYLGFGPAAASHWEGERRRNLPDLRGYVARLGRGESPVTERECLAPERKARELLMTGLRQVAGVPRQWFRNRTGFDIEELAGEALAGFVDAGWVEQDAERVRITPEGIYLSNRIFEAIL